MNGTVFHLASRAALTGSVQREGFYRQEEGGARKLPAKAKEAELHLLPGSHTDDLTSAKWKLTGTLCK